MVTFPLFSARATINVRQKHRQDHKMTLAYELLINKYLLSDYTTANDRNSQWWSCCSYDGNVPTRIYSVL